jgi:putative nucleotidyltransferase with HDIG domain
MMEENNNKGFYISDSDSYIEKFEQKSAMLGLLAKGNGCEIMIQEVEKDSVIFLEPGDNKELLEFFYVLKGSLSVIDGGNRYNLRENDVFYGHHLTKTVEFKSTSDTKLLYLTTEPVFHYLSSTIKELTTLAQEVEKKDIYTHNHIQRVRDYSLKIANKLNLSKEMTENIVFAALFHDIGKVNVPDEVLMKKSGLTEQEYEVIKQHPSGGLEIVSKTYFKKVSKIIEQHHERMDGSGYPKGLKGDDILLEARIIAVADAYDAMTTDRPYRKALTPQEAVLELNKNQNSQFDAIVVTPFLEILHEEGIYY